MQTRLVEPSVESLNSGDTFLLVTDKHLHVWLGKDANVMKKSKVFTMMRPPISRDRDNSKSNDNESRNHDKDNGNDYNDIDNDNNKIYHKNDSDDNYDSNII